MSLERSFDLSPAEWVHQGPGKGTGNDQSEGLQGVPVSRCIPAGFDSYAKALHPIYADPDIEDPILSWHRAAGRPSTGVLSEGVLSSDSSPGYAKGQRVLWRDLAQRYDLEFHPEISSGSFARVFPERSWPSYLIGPDEGHLDEGTCLALIDILKSFTFQQRCWFYYSGISIDPYEPRLYSGELDDVLSLPKQKGVRALPEYWWPEDHCWCINSDWDLNFTLVGGSSALIQCCLEHSFLEAVPVSLTTRVDSYADVQNPRRRMRQVAELVLADQMSLSLAARAMIGLARAAGKESDPAFASFAQIERETNGLPIGAVRARWAPEALESKDRDIHRIETAHRANALEACRAILLKAPF
jgi:hypothetical protein